MADLYITSPGTYDGNWETYEYIEVNASPVTLRKYIISKTGYNILLSWYGGQLTLQNCIFDGWWGVNTNGNGNLTARDCVFSTQWGINTSGNNILLVNNLFIGGDDYGVNSWGDSIIAINNTFYGWWGKCFNLWSSSLTLKNNIFSHNYGTIVNAWGSSFSVGTNLKSGNSSWYSDQEVPTGNLILADPCFTSQSSNVFNHDPYPNGYFLYWYSPAIDAGENEPGNPPYGCLGTTALGDTPDNIDLANSIDLGFHYPFIRFYNIILQENVRMHESGSTFHPPEVEINDLLLITDKVIPGFIKISVSPLLFGPLKDLWIGGKS